MHHPVYHHSGQAPVTEGTPAEQDGARAVARTLVLELTFLQWGPFWLTSRAQGKACLPGGGAGSTHRQEVNAY